MSARTIMSELKERSELTIKRDSVYLETCSESERLGQQRGIEVGWWRESTPAPMGATSHELICDPMYAYTDVTGL